MRQRIAELEALEGERKRAEEKIRDLARFLDESPNPVLRVAKDGTILYANTPSSSLLNAWGCQIGQRLPSSWRQLVLDVISSGVVREVEIESENRVLSLACTPVVEADYVNLYGRDITDREKAEEGLRNAAVETLLAVSSLVEARDPYTSGHSQRVTEYALAIAKRMELPEAELETLRIAGLLHDVGKIGIPDAVLNKAGRLTRSEWLTIYAHPTESASLVEKVAAFHNAVPAIRHHHELWDGTGYPDGLKGEEIPLLARILAVGDWYEAMSSDRPYRTALSQEEVLEEIRANAGIKLDPKVVQVFLELIAQGAIREGKR